MTTQVMAADAAVQTSVLSINQEKPLSLRRLLIKAGISEDAEAELFWQQNSEALRFWRHSGLSRKTKKHLSGSAIEFATWDGTVSLAEVTQQIFLQTMKPAVFYEVLLFATSNPECFRATLKQAPILVTSGDKDTAYLIISLTEDKQITLRNVKAIDDIDHPVLIGGVYLL